MSVMQKTQSVSLTGLNLVLEDVAFEWSGQSKNVGGLGAKGLIAQRSHLSIQNHRKLFSSLTLIPSTLGPGTLKNILSSTERYQMLGSEGILLLCILRCKKMLPELWKPLMPVGSWIELFQWSMRFVMMMTKEMGIVLIEEGGMGHLMEGDDPLAHIVGKGAVLIMDVGLLQIPDLNDGVVPNMGGEVVPFMAEVEAQSMTDTEAVHLHVRDHNLEKEDYGSECCHSYFVINCSICSAKLTYYESTKFCLVDDELGYLSFFDVGTFGFMLCCLWFLMLEGIRDGIRMKLFCFCLILCLL